MASAIHSFPPPEECDASTASKPKTPLSPTSHNLPSLKPVLRPSTSAPRKSDDSTRVRFEGVLSPNEWEGKEEEDVSMVEVTSDDDSVRLAGSQEVPKEEAADEEAEEGLAPLHIEVRLLPSSTVRFDLIRRMMHTHLNDEYETLLTHSEINDWREVAALAQNVDRVWVAECSLPSSAVPLTHTSLQIHVYQPPLSSAVTEFATPASGSDDGQGEDSDVMAASVLSLPSRSLEGVWDSLVYEDDVKGKLLGYIYSTMLFSDACVDFNIVTWNRVVLLHGPPGTGKTSLCRALAQKLAIRLSDRYEHGKLVEINSHSLFSKWFSESGKLVQRLFAAVTDMVDDESGFVVVLIDEVESLTAARAGAMEGKEPSDALRVVNALLTQLDKLKHRKNCLVMTTSNLSAAIDGAFIDRADIKQYIGLPPPQAIYWILQSCLSEIMRAGLISPVTLHDWQAVEVFRSTGSPSTDRDWTCSSLLFDLAHLCKGVSGRTLRRLPVLAHAKHIGMTMTKTKPKMEVWLRAMAKSVQEEGEQMDKVEGKS